jgi:hypothetical protein
MDSDEGMLRLDWFAADEFAVSLRILGLRVAAMLCAETLKKGLDGLRETVVRSCLGSPCRVSAGLRDGEQSQDGDSWRLVLVGYVRVVSDCGEFVALAAVAVLVVWTEVDVVQFQVVFDVCPDRLWKSCQ